MRRETMRRLSRTASCLVAILLTATAQAEERKEIVISAAELASPSQRADKPMPGKWWLKRDARDWGAREGTILLTGSIGEGPTKTGEWVVPPPHLFVPY